MADHIYGRVNIMEDVQRPNMFIAELNLYVDFVKEQLENENTVQFDVKRKKYYVDFFNNLHAGINYYKNLPKTVEPDYTLFSQLLNVAADILEKLNCQYSIYTHEKIISEV